MSLQALYWSEPLWLLLVLQPIAFLFFRWLHNRKQLNRYASPELQPWVEVHVPKHWSHSLANRNSIYFSAWLLIAIAAAGPRLIEEIPDGGKNHSANIMVVVDISRSMHVQDVSPNRLTHVKQKLLALVPQLQQDRLGLVVYAAHAHQYMPFTSDKNIMRHFMNNLDELSPPTQGSHAAEALILAEQLLQKQTAVPEKSQAIILISDGEGLKSSPESSVPIFTLGVGSIEGDAVPGYDGEWLEENNRVLVSRLREDDLIKLSAKNKGLYSQSYKNNSDWDVIYHYGIKRIKNSSSINNTDKVLWRELYVYALFPGIILLILSTIKLNSKSRTETSSTPISQPSGKIAVLIFSIILIPVGNNAKASEDSSAHRSDIEEDYVSAIEKYRRIDGYSGRFGEASSAYRLNDSAHAISSFKQAFLTARNDQQRASALYNLGNSHFQAGDYTAAINSYQDSLIYMPDNKSAKKNLSFSLKLHKTVQKRLARLQKLLRPGRGPKSSSIDNKTSINEDDTSVSVDESNDVLEPEIENVIEYMVTIPEELVLKGLEHAQLASEDTLINTSSDKDSNAYSFSISKQNIDMINDDQKAFWNRIFEAEEDFPAPLDRPQQIKGVKAW